MHPVYCYKGGAEIQSSDPWLPYPFDKAHPDLAASLMEVWGGVDWGEKAPWPPVTARGQLVAAALCLPRALFLHFSSAFP